MAGVVDELRRILQEETVVVVGRCADRMERTYQEVVPRDTGELASAFRADIFPLGDVVRLHAEVDDETAPHGKWIDQPVDEIVPVNARALHWFSKSGDDVFARRVVPSRVHEGWWKRFVDQAVAEFDV